VADGATLTPGWRAAAFEQLADQSLDGVWACDSALRCLYWNAAMERLTGMPAAGVLGGDMVAVLARIGHAYDGAAIRAVLEGARTVTFEQGPAATPPRESLLRSHCMPIRSEAGAAIGVAAIVRDVTEETRIRQDLRETDARFRNMADAAPVLLWMSRSDGLCTFFNQTWLEFTGRTLEQEWGEGWAENVHADDLAACMHGYTTAFNARQTFEMEYRLRRKDGEYRWILDRGTPRYTPDGHFAGYIGSGVDITERRQLEAELRGAVEARDDFLSVASHELRTPLTVLRLHTDQLQRAIAAGSAGAAGGAAARAAGAAVSRSLESRVVSIAAEVRRLGQLVETLLDTTRLAATGGWKLNPERLQLGAQVQQVLRDLAPVAEAAKCAVTFHEATVLYGMWDRDRLQHALTNIMVNAFKFGAGAPVEVTVTSDGNLAVARVRDHGVGLPPEQQELIFQRFGRAPHTHGYGGLGLGLWIARQSIDAMGGSIRVHSASGQGATFEIVVPLEREPSSLD
jgi:PAS domain S-box-containing protein